MAQGLQEEESKSNSEASLCNSPMYRMAHSDQADLAVQVSCADVAAYAVGLDADCNLALLLSLWPLSELYLCAKPFLLHTCLRQHSISSLKIAVTPDVRNAFSLGLLSSAVSIGYIPEIYSGHEKKVISVHVQVVSL